jgi:hypothetical protein
MSDLVDSFAVLDAPKRRVSTRSKKDALDKLSKLPKAELDELVALTQADEETEMVERPISPVTGKAEPSRAEAIEAMKANVQAAFQLRRQLLADSFSVTETTALLDVASRQTIHDRIQSGALLAIKDKHQFRLPAWQFDSEADDGVVAGLKQTLKELPTRSTFARTLWFVTPKPQLGGRTPLQALREGDLNEVLAEARAVGAT